MTKHLWCVFVSVLFLYSPLAPHNHEFAAPPEWEDALLSHMQVLRMSTSREKRICDFHHLLLNVAALTDIKQEYKSTLLCLVRESFREQLNEDLETLRFSTQENPDAALAKEQLKALNVYTPWIRSFTFKNKKKIAEAVATLHELYEFLPPSLHYEPEVNDSLTQVARKKLQRRNRITNNLIIAAVAGTLGLDCIATLLLMYKNSGNKQTFKKHKEALCQLKKLPPNWAQQLESQGPTALTSKQEEAFLSLVRVIESSF